MLSSSPQGGTSRVNLYPLRLNEGQEACKVGESGEVVEDSGIDVCVDYLVLGTAIGHSVDGGAGAISVCSDWGSN